MSDHPTGQQESGAPRRKRGDRASRIRRHPAVIAANHLVIAATRWEFTDEEVEMVLTLQRRLKRIAEEETP